MHETVKFKPKKVFKKEIKIAIIYPQSGEIRNLFHFHFTEWAERSIPLNGVGLFDMMKCVTRVQQQTGNGPIVVHCRYVL